MVNPKRLFAKLSNALYTLYNLKNELDVQKMLSAKLLLQNNRSRFQDFVSDIHLSELQVFSQWGDDGIIQFLVNYLQIEHTAFIEFGVESLFNGNFLFFAAHLGQVSLQ